MVQLALRSALSDRAVGGKIVVIDQWTFEVPRTKDAVAALSALGLKGRILVVLGIDDGYADRSFGNLTDIQTIMVSELNAYDILCNDWIVFTDATLPGGDASDGPPAAKAPAPAKDSAAAESATADTAAADTTATAEPAVEAAADTEPEATTDTDTEAETSTEGSDS
jgi:large subunit ribosomal protein L4